MSIKYVVAYFYCYDKVAFQRPIWGLEFLVILLNDNFFFCLTVQLFICMNLRYLSQYFVHIFECRDSSQWKLVTKTE